MEKRRVNFELKQLEKVLKIYRGGRTKNEEIFHLFRLKSKSSEIVKYSFLFNMISNNLHVNRIHVRLV